MKKFLGILLVLIIAALIAALIYFKGFGGFGKDSGEGKKDDVSVPQTTESTEASTEATTADEEKTETAEITVSGHDYLFNNEKMTLEALTAEIAKLDKEAQITITSDNTAAKNTVDELTDKLDELGYKNYKKLDK